MQRLIAHEIGRLWPTHPHSTSSGFFLSLHKYNNITYDVEHKKLSRTQKWGLVGIIYVLNILTQDKWVTQKHKTSSRFFPSLYKNEEEEKNKSVQEHKSPRLHIVVLTHVLYCENDCPQYQKYNFNIRLAILWSSCFNLEQEVWCWLLIGILAGAEETN